METEILSLLKSIGKDLPTGDDVGFAVTSDRELSKYPWIEMDRDAFTNDEDWEELCKIAGCNPDKTAKIRIYIHEILTDQND